MPIILLRTLNHPNVVRFYGVYSASELEQYMVFELLEEGSLDRLLQNKGQEIAQFELLNMY